MGSGIALSAALAGIEVRLTDINLAAAQNGRAYAERVLGRQVSKGLRTEGDAAATLARITPVANMADLAGADLVIEAIVEDAELKAKVIAEVVGVVAADAVLASNTSTLPITSLAEAVDYPENFVGLHFFSPVERMDLVEIVVGERTSDATLAKAFDVVLQLGKIPIVVKDGRGFFTSRVILQRLLEAAAMLGEGICPTSIEQASMQAGYPIGTLALLDEISLSLPYRIYGQFRASATRTAAKWVDHPGGAVLGFMVDEANRPGRAAGGGFYQYVDGRRAGLWPGLEDRFGPSHPPPDLHELSERFLFTEALDTARCLESGLLRSAADANVGSMLGIGYPKWTGGAAQYVTGYPGGAAGFVARASALAAEYGPRFDVPQSLLDKAAVSNNA
jgi:3-hydroxyacyl-CoA dehydrogenase/enoyl-CoA hydratase/3-hydroxybutyryl-CoA epimerase